MATDGDVDTSRARVQTYVPAYQEEEWRRHADELDMSLSEFVRSMTQAGRRGFEPDESGDDGPSDEESAGTPSSTGKPGGRSVEDRVVDALSEEAHLDWDELVDAVVGDVEREVEEALDDLQSEDRVHYSGRKGGYHLA